MFSSKTEFSSAVANKLLNIINVLFAWNTNKMSPIEASNFYSSYKSNSNGNCGGNRNFNRNGTSVRDRNLIPENLQNATGEYITQVENNLDREDEVTKEQIISKNTVIKQSYFVALLTLECVSLIAVITMAIAVGLVISRQRTCNDDSKAGVMVLKEKAVEIENEYAAMKTSMERLLIKVRIIFCRALSPFVSKSLD